LEATKLLLLTSSQRGAVLVMYFPLSHALDKSRAMLIVDDLSHT
jgi:hypothetical protein